VSSCCRSETPDVHRRVGQIQLGESAADAHARGGGGAAPAAAVTFHQRRLLVSLDNFWPRPII
jgi:hypothetical protein